MSDVRKVVIIGSGPAGLTAAIYTARANLEPLLIEGEPSSTSDQPGGQLMLTTEVENFPGFPEGIMGPELMMRFREQAARFGTEIITEKVTKVDFSARPYSVWIGDPDAAEPTYRAEAVIVSTGAQSLMLGLESEQRLLGHGLSTCATCDGFFFRDHHIAVVGGGDSAVEEALFLTKFASKVTLIHRRDELRASKIMQDRAFANDKIEFLWNHTVTEVMGDTTVDRHRGAQRAHRRGVDAAHHRRVRGHRPPAQHRPVQGPARDGGQRLPGHPRRLARPTSRGCSPAATCRTTSTARPSPRRARAAWPPSTPNGGSKPSITAELTAWPAGAVQRPWNTWFGVVVSATMAGRRGRGQPRTGQIVSTLTAAQAGRVTS